MRTHHTPGQPAAREPFGLLCERLRSGERRLAATGLQGAARAWLVAKLAAEGGASASPGPASPIIALCSDEEACEVLTAELALFHPDVLHLPCDEQLPYDVLSPARDTACEQLAALHRLIQGAPTPGVIVLSMRALARRVLPPALMRSLSTSLAVGDELDRGALAARLVRLGYQNVPVVEDVGSFAVRGGIVDLYSPLHERPARLEFFGDTVESIRLFDPATQLTAGALERVALCPARELLFDAERLEERETAIRELAESSALPSSRVRELIDLLREERPSPALEPLMPALHAGGLSSLFDYLGALSGAPLVVMLEPAACDRALIELESELAREYAQSREREELSLPPADHYLPAAQLRERLGALRLMECHALHLAIPGEAEPVAFALESTGAIRQELLAHRGEEGALAPLVDRLTRWREQGYLCAIACATSGSMERLEKLFSARRLKSARLRGGVPLARLSPRDARLKEGGPLAQLALGAIGAGFVDPGQRLALLSDEEIFGARARRAPARKGATSEQPFLASFRELKEGDLVVHADYGIGRYLGMRKMTLRSIDTDVLVLEYAGGDKVYLPVVRLRLLQKFSGAESEGVALDRLGSSAWEKRKQAVKEHLLKMAAELLRIQAAREAHPGHAFTPPDEEYRDFEAAFPYEETPDQARAIEAVLGDMARPRPMDRLVCGDVGYGKTEVALRAAFKAVLDKKQVAVLVPTTLLAAQHQRTFRERLAPYAVNVEMVSRLRPTKENREVLERLSRGAVDIVIGTHRLLNADVSFHDLGLLVVDEEQRFGVTHKERLKRYRSQVDVLTLTATPIPRTLHMSMSGLRDLSIIASPPEDRKAIRTFVMKYDEVVIAEAIRREIARGGQAYFVHNRVETIEGKREELQRLMPELRFGVAHGQMEEGQLERVMTSFVERKQDVLICSSIIESGLDIPSANTLIVDRADTFGLAQLYQIRGRVGRSAERAYAYLLVPPKRPVTKEANQRLEVLQSFTELGAGFSIASHDLEIRGAGNLLGPDQSGQIAAVGFDLYSQLMEEAVSELRGEAPATVVDPDVALPIPAFIPEPYLPDVGLRLQFYKRFSQARDEEELAELRGELTDRFGPLPEETENLSELMEIKCALRALAIRQLESGPGRLVFTLGGDAHLEPLALQRFIQDGKGTRRLTPEQKLVVTLPAETSESKRQEPKRLLEACRDLLAELMRSARQEFEPPERRSRS